MYQDLMELYAIRPEDDCDSDKPGDEWEWVGEGEAGLLPGKK
jgi:hypothetical protein